MLVACTISTPAPPASNTPLPTFETDVLGQSTLTFDNDTIQVSPIDTPTDANARTETVIPVASTQEPSSSPTIDTIESTPEQTAVKRPTEANVEPTSTNTPPPPTQTLASADSDPTRETTAGSPTPNLSETEVDSATSPASETETVEPETPAASVSPAPPLGETTAVDVQIITRDMQILIGQSIEIPLTLQPFDAEIGAVTIDLSYDPAVVELQQCQMDIGTGVCNPSTPGFISIAAVNGNATQGNLVLVTFVFTGRDSGNAQFQISQVRTLTSLTGEQLTHAAQIGAVIVP